MGLDRVAAVLFIAIVLWYSVDTEVLLVQDRAMSTKKWSREGVDAAKVQVELNAMNANYRFGHVQLLYIPILLCIALEGRGWRPRVAARWPLEPSLFASFNANMGAAYCAAIFLRTLQLRGLASWRAMWLGSNVPVACALLAVLADRCAAGAGVTRGLDEVADAYAAPFANCGGGGGGSGGSVVGL
ncbi:hypothetical protein JKP88DRAFT_272386 [Tribonema minus]|uniref:Uncharacterized protein n=1 Tax=Tribonema minus TaxID=303371 RepID=A0A835ZEP4_9STRA|nr:hypothetical protein JKP88DRAFT_272386 [Tribonema minus]